MARILIVDDEPSMRRILTSNLRQDQHQAWEAGGVEEACRALLVNTFDVVFTDQKMPDGEGLAVLAVAHEIDPAISMVLMMARETIELAVESMRQGAFDFLTKPFQPDVLRATARRAAEHTQLLRENVLLKRAMVCLEGTSEIHGHSPAMHSVRDTVTRVAMPSAWKNAGIAGKSPSCSIPFPSRSGNTPCSLKLPARYGKFRTTTLSSLLGELFLTTS